MAIYTAGFAEWTAEAFFRRLKNEGVTRLLDVRLRPTSQLSGFAKQRDLKFFLAEIVGAEYRHLPQLAPTAELLDLYRTKQLSWDEYASEFNALMASRSIETSLDRFHFSGRPLLLCSEHDSDKCHRRLVVEYLEIHWGNLGDVIHLKK